MVEINRDTSRADRIGRALRSLVLPVALAATLAGGVFGLSAGGATPALAQFYGGGSSGGFGGGERPNEDPRSRMTVSIRTVQVGEFCVRAVEAIGYDPRLNQRLYRLGFDSGPMTSLGVVAFENAFSSARTQGDAVRALAAAQSDARPYRRGPGQC